MAVFPELWSEVWSFSVARGADCCSEEERILSWKEKRSFPCTLSIIMGETSIGVSISLVYERKDQARSPVSCLAFRGVARFG